MNQELKNKIENEVAEISDMAEIIAGRCRSTDRVTDALLRAILDSTDYLRGILTGMEVQA